MKAAFVKFGGAQKVVAKKVKEFPKDPVAKCEKALGSIGECLGKTCKCQDISKCASKMCTAHADATDAIAQIGENTAKPADDDDKNSDAGKASGVALAEPTPQGESPENGAENMDEVQKAQLATAEKNSAEALDLAKKTNEGLDKLAGVIGQLAEVIVGQPVQAKSVAASPVAVITKTGENTPAATQAATASDPQSVAKSILASPKMLTDRELSQLNIGR
jgi:hypothetical protein